MTEYKGRYLLPISNTTNLIVLYFESDVSTNTSNYSTIIRQEIETLIRDFSSIEGSCLFARKNNISYGCDQNFYNADMGVYFNYRTGNYYISLSSTETDYQFAAAPGTAYLGGVNLHGLVKTANNRYCLVRIAYIILNQDMMDAMGLIPPVSADPGYAVLNMLPNPTITLANYNQTTANRAISAYFEINPPQPIPPTHSDPYSDGGSSEPGGGGGSFDDSTDVITIPEYDPVDLLNRSYGNRGFVHVYLPTQAELTSLHAFMWDNSLVTDMQKMFGNVADAVISLNLLPLDFTDITPNRGNILMGLVDSQIQTTIAKQQFVTLDCGTIEINEFFASYLDYSPYSKLQIYLPYIGVKDLDIDEFMNAYISVKYVIDIVSGDCVAFISKSGAIDNAVVKDNPILGVLYQFAGNCALNVPISGSNYAQMHAADIGALISGAGVLGNFLTGGMSAPSAVTGILSTAANVVTSKPTISRGGSTPSTVGYMSIQKPYLILTRPRMCLPEDQNTFTGYPAYVTMTPGDTSGYTEFEIIHLENIPATDAEKNELETLMKTGVIL